MIKNKNLLRLTKTIVLFEIFFLALSTPLLSQAGTTGRTNAAMDRILERLNTDDEAIQRDITDRLGSSYLKIRPPSVRVTFLPANPKPGQRVTARAEAIDFQSKTEDMYYTWMLKNGDGDVNAEEAKLNATRAMYENYVPGLVGNRSQPPEEAIVAFDDPRDGYSATLGGHGNVQRENYCYLYDFESGQAYELNTFADKVDDPFPCPDGSTPVCAETDENECPLVTPPTTGVAEGGGGGEGGANGEAGGGGEGGSVEICGPEGPTTFKLKMCDLAGSPTCDVRKGISCGSGKAKPYCLSDEVFTDQFPFCPRPDDLAEQLDLKNLCEVDRLPEELPDFSCEAFVDAGVLEPLAICDAITEDDVENFNPCEGISGPGDKSWIHLWYKNDSDLNLGDGQHPDLDEEFLGSNPYLERTEISFPGSQVDEAIAVGLGITEFTWTYQPGDKVNLVVEGYGTTTLHKDSSRQIVWGFLNDSCSAKDFIEDGKKTGGYTTDANKAIETIAVERDDLNDCLGKDENFVAPGQGDLPGTLSVDLSFSPENPSASSAAAEARGRIGDLIVVRAGATNSTKDTSAQYYTWCAEFVEAIDTSRDGDNFGRTDQNKTCAEYENILADDNIVEMVGAPEGLGKSQIHFRLNEADGKYIRVRAEINENFVESRAARAGEGTRIGAEGLTQDGGAVAYIPLNVSGSYIGAYEGASGSSLAVGEEYCGTGGLDAASCRVAKNEVIALRVESGEVGGADNVGDFTWQIKGAEECKTDCPTENQYTTYITPTGIVGDSVHVTANGTNVKTGENITVSRAFKIVDPFIQVVADGGATPKQLGAYRDLEGVEYPDESNAAFEAAPGSSVSFSAVCHPRWACRDDANLVWNVNGTRTTGATASAELAGGANVEVEGLFAPAPETRKLLSDHFGVSQFNSTERLMTHTVRVDELGAAIAQNGSERFLATIATNTPAYFLFLLRIALTTLLILFVAGLAMNLGQAPRPRE